MSEKIEVFKELFTPVADELDLIIENIEYNQAGKKGRLFIVLDKEEGLTLEDSQLFSKKAQDILEEAENAGLKIPAELIFDAGSAGIERPLGCLRHVRHAFGRRIALENKEYRVGALSADNTHVALMDESGKISTLPIEDIFGAITQVDFKAPGAQVQEFLARTYDEIA